MSGSVEVGDEHLEAVPVDVGEGELGAGVGVFAAGDHPAPAGQPRQVDRSVISATSAWSRQLAAVGGDRRLPALGSARRPARWRSSIGELVADHEPHLSGPAGVDEAV